MKPTAEVVIIGAGIMGCASAHALAERGHTAVIVRERDQIGRGATADAVCQQVSTATTLRLAQESVRVWERFPERFGRDIGLRQQGSLLLITAPTAAAVCGATIAWQQRRGVPSRWVTPKEISELNPHVVLDDVIGGAFCPEDGWCDPYGATIGCAPAARAIGVRIEEETPVTGITIAGDCVKGVQTPQGNVSAPLIPADRSGGAGAGAGDRRSTRRDTGSPQR